MSNSFWNFVTRMVSGELAKADDVNTNFDGVEAGFTLVETDLDSAMRVTNAPGVTDVTTNAATRALKLISFDVNGDIVATTPIGDWKGDHADAAGTDYTIRDTVKDAAGSIGQDNIYICTATHTSTGDLATDTANWDLLFDVAAAAASAAAALVSENNAATSYDDFDDRYLGDFTTGTEPALDNDGDALLTGALYFNTTLNRMKVYNGASWQLTTANAVDVVVADAGGHLTATDVEAALAEIAVLTKFLSVTQAVNLDTIESGLGTAQTDITNIETKTNWITVTQAVNLDTIESNTNTNNAKVTNANHTGDATGATALTLAAAAITGKTALSSGLAGTDELLVSDAGALKRMDVSVMNAYFNANLAFNNYTHPNHTGDATGAGALTLAAAAITGKTALASGLASTDEILISDAGVLKRMDISVLEELYQAQTAVATNHTRAGNMQLIDGSQTIASFNAGSNITINTWETLGPTGSGATNIWAEMDDMPSNANVLICDLFMDLTPGHATALAQLFVYGAKGGITPASVSGPNNAIGILYADYNEIGTRTTVTVRVQIPVSTSQICQIQWSRVQSSSTNVFMYYRGFLTD